MQSPDHPELVFVQAAGFTAGRPDGPPLWIVVHDMEAGESSTRAESTAAYFANPSDGRSVSSHYCVDNDSVVQCVLLKHSAWTVGNRPGNNRGINWELSGFANQTRAQWLDPFGLAMFEQMAPIVRADASKYGIPLTRRTVAELQAFKPGITSHNDLRLAFGGTTHTDPGSNFPWDVFLDIINGGDVALTSEDIAAIWAHNIASSGTYSAKGALYDANNRTGALSNTQVPALQVDLDALQAAVVAMDAKLDAILGMLSANGGGAPANYTIALSGTATPIG